MQMQFVGMPAPVAPSTVCPWCREDPCLYDCEEEVRKYEEGDYGDDWDAGYEPYQDLSREQIEKIRNSSWQYILDREKDHQKAGIPMWDHKPLGRQMDTVPVNPGFL